MKNYDNALKMYMEGSSIQSVANRYSITRQAMWKILKRRGCIFRPKERFGEANHFHRGTMANGSAQNKLEKAILSGKVQRKTVCEACGASGRFKDGRSMIQAHHPDYNKPFDVMWLCQRCHHNWHKTNRAV